jgi:hypothetical protein
LAQRRIVNKLCVQRPKCCDGSLQRMNSIIKVHRIFFLGQAGVDDRPALVDGSKEETPVFGAHAPTNVCAEVNH